jgi:hypothetical protein
LDAKVQNDWLGIGILLEIEISYERQTCGRAAIAYTFLQILGGSAADYRAVGFTTTVSVGNDGTW